MITLEAKRAATLDASAREFISTFMAHVATVAGHDENRLATIARVHVLLLAALAAGDGAASAWSMLHRTIAEMVPESATVRNTRGAFAYLQSFIRENGDLVHD